MQETNADAKPNLHKPYTDETNSATRISFCSNKFNANSKKDPGVKIPINDALQLSKREKRKTKLSCLLILTHLPQPKARLIVCQT